MALNDQNAWARSRAREDDIAWAMDLTESERATLVESMPSTTWSRADQARYAAVLVVVADRDELGLDNAGLATFPGRALPGLSPESAPETTFPQLLATPIDEIVEELNELKMRAADTGGLSAGELSRLGLLWTALTILKDPDDPTPSP